MFNLTRAGKVLAGSIAITAITLAPAAAGPVSQWAQFGGDASHSSYINDAAAGAHNAGAFGVAWMANLFSPYLGSPVVAYNAHLKKTLVYVGDERGDVYALDALTGAQIWSTNLGYGDAVRATPAVATDGFVWVGTNYNAALYKLEGSTGQVICSSKSLNGTAIMGSPMIVAPKNGRRTVYWDSLDSGEPPVGPLVSTDATTCAQNFNATISSGSWTTPAYGVNGAGEPLIFTGTADPDNFIYAVDANTGAIAWHFAAYPSPSGWDVGAAQTSSAPGVNGFANGALYASSEYGNEYALDMNNGTPLWTYQIYPKGYIGKRYIISSAALDGSKLVIAYNKGVIALNAATGSQLWSDATTAPVDSSPAIIGAPGDEIVAVGDLGGAVRLYSLSAGSQLYSYQTGGYIVSSAAEYNGIVYIASTDGFLYAFKANGGNATAPQSAVTSPAAGATVANTGTVSVAGSSTDSAGVGSVEVAIQSGSSSGLWYNASSNTWQNAPYRNPVSVASPGSTSSTWSTSFPVPPSGGSYRVFVNSVNIAHIVDKGTSSSFVVSPSATEPVLFPSVTTVAPGEVMSVAANNFKGNETVSFSMFGTVVATATATAKGHVFKTKFAVPDASTFGPASITATGQTSGKTSSTTVIVSNEWTQGGYGATRTSNEPHDTIIAHTIFVGASILNLDYMYNSGAPINTSPAVVDGVAYFGNDAGTLTAINAVSGSPAWTYTVPTNAAIQSSPAVDDTGNIVFGANDGTVYMLAKNGALLRTVHVGGHMGSPAYADGTIVIAAANGYIYSFQDPTLVQNWRVNAGSTITSPPAFDAAANLVFAGTSDGRIIAYNSATGAVVWTVTTGGQVNGISVGNGRVYAASNDGYLHVVKESDGSAIYTYKGNGPATAVGLFAKSPAFATANGEMYELDGTGALLFSREYEPSALVGLGGAYKDFFSAAVDGNLGMLRPADGSWQTKAGTGFGAAPVVLNGMLFAGSRDGNLYAFTPQGYSPAVTSTRVGTATVQIDGSGTDCAASP